MDNVQIFANDSVVSVNDSVSDRQGLCVPVVFKYTILFFTPSSKYCTPLPVMCFP